MRNHQTFPTFVGLLIIAAMVFAPGCEQKPTVPEYGLEVPSGDFDYYSVAWMPEVVAEAFRNGNSTTQMKIQHDNFSFKLSTVQYGEYDEQGNWKLIETYVQWVGVIDDGDGWENDTPDCNLDEVTFIVCRAAGRTPLRLLLNQVTLVITRKTTPNGDDIFEFQPPRFGSCWSNRAGKVVAGGTSASDLSHLGYEDFDLIDVTIEEFNLSNLFIDGSIPDDLVVEKFTTHVEQMEAIEKLASVKLKQ